MQIGPWFFGRGWCLLLPALLALAWHRVEDLRAAHQLLRDAATRYSGVRQDMRQIRSEAMSRMKTERRSVNP
jgi:hypothetical protein